MTTLSQMPAELDIETTTRDDFSALLDFDISLVGYTFTSYVEHGTSTTAITVTNTSLANGQITISLTNAQLAAIGQDKHKWYLSWNDGTNDRAVLAGTFRINNYP
jgi:hypothetical protein